MVIGQRRDVLEQLAFLVVATAVHVPLEVQAVPFGNTVDHELF
jgi:hypothetical protein